MVESIYICINYPGGMSSQAPDAAGRRGSSVHFDVTMEKPSRPPRQPKSPPEGPIEVLTLTHFTSAPRLDFDVVKVGNKRVRHIQVVNPHDYPQHVTVEKFPYKKNFRYDSVDVLRMYEKNIGLAMLRIWGLYLNFHSNFYQMYFQLGNIAGNMQGIILSLIFVLI